MEKIGKLRTYNANRVVEQKLDTILNSILSLRHTYNCVVYFDNTIPNHYKLTYNDKNWEFGTYTEIIRALDMLKTILEDREVLK